LFGSNDPIHAWLKGQRWKLLRRDPIGYLLLEGIRLVREEWLVRWLYGIKDKKPELFAAAAPHVLMGIEINIVVRKP
jgi:hypothetical protein